MRATPTSGSSPAPPTRVLYRQCAAGMRRVTSCTSPATGPSTASPSPLRERETLDKAEIDLLIDDGPLNLAAALDRGIAVATIRHPWNRDLCDEEDILGARDWPELERLLEPLLARQGMEVGAAK